MLKYGGIRKIIAQRLGFKIARSDFGASLWSRSIVSLPDESTSNRTNSRTFGLLGLSMVLLTTSISDSNCSVDKGTNIPTLYQFATCPFCNRAKVLLDYLGIPYKSVEVNPVTRSEIKFSKDYRKVPIATFPKDVGNGSVAVETVKDSNTIISYIVDHYIARNSATNINLSDFMPEDTQYWNEWSEKKLAITLYPNIASTYQKSWESFKYAATVEEWNVFERLMVQVIGTPFMKMAASSTKKKYNIQDERGELRKTIQEWTDAVGEKEFLHGSQITLPDLVVYGVLRSIEGCTAFTELMAENQQLANWYSRVANATVSQDVRKRRAIN